MEQNQQIKLSKLHSKLVIDQQEASDLKARLAEQSSEFESRMLEMKRHLAEEEVKKKKLTRYEYCGSPLTKTPSR